MSFFKSLKNEFLTLRNLFRNRLFASPKTQAEIVREFHKLYYNSHKFSNTFNQTTWLGIKALKCPLDLWVYQEILFEKKPDLLIETGTCEGGSALYLATICDLIGKGRVVTIDIEHREGRPEHPRIQYITGSSTDPAVIARLHELKKPTDEVIVFLDSNHEKGHVLEELRIYKNFVTRGSYLLVEDTNINNHPVYPDFGPGPMEALDEFLRVNDEFVVDQDRQKFLLTFNPRGFLKKVK